MILNEAKLGNLVDNAYKVLKNDAFYNNSMVLYKGKIANFDNSSEFEKRMSLLKAKLFSYINLAGGHNYFEKLIYDIKFVPVKKKENLICESLYT